MNGSTIHTRVSLSSNHANVKARSGPRYFGVPPANALSDGLMLSHQAAEIYSQEEMRARWGVRPNVTTNTMMMQSGTEVVFHASFTITRMSLSGGSSTVIHAATSTAELGLQVAQVVSTLGGTLWTAFAPLR